MVVAQCDALHEGGTKAGIAGMLHETGRWTKASVDYGGEEKKNGTRFVHLSDLHNDPKILLYEAKI